MTLDQQLQVLIDHAPQDGTTPDVVKVIAPALKMIAEQLKHSQYYVLQTLDQHWVMTTLSHRTQPDMQKKVVYGFPTLKDVALAPESLKDPQLVALPVPVTHILFQMMAMKTIDSLVFFDTPGDAQGGTEVRREDLEHLVQLHLQQARAAAPPPDIA